MLSLYKSLRNRRQMGRNLWVFITSGKGNFLFGSLKGADCYQIGGLIPTLYGTAFAPYFAKSETGEG
jgi:hypothetical protein